MKQSTCINFSLPVQPPPRASQSQHLCPLSQGCLPCLLGPLKLQEATPSKLAVSTSSIFVTCFFAEMFWHGKSGVGVQ